MQDSTAAGQPAGEPMIRLERVSKVYPDGTVAVEPLDLDVRAGEITVLVGPSGCGKTTTMRMINRLIEPTSGRIYLEGEDVTTVDPVQLRRRMGYVIQQVGLFPHLTIEANVATVPTLLGWDRSRRKARARELLELVGLDPEVYAKRYPAQLSGGQQQRVGVARALAADPPVLLMDEPFAAVDPVARYRLQDEFLRLQAELAKTIVFVTHDLDEAVRLGDRIAVFSIGGVLEQFDTPAAVLGAPATPFVTDFVGRDRVLRVLSVTPLTRAHLSEGAATGIAADLPRVALGVPLREALVAVMESRDGMVAATDPAGEDADRVVGVLTANDLHRAAQREREALQDG